MPVLNFSQDFIDLTEAIQKSKGNPKMHPIRQSETSLHLLVDGSYFRRWYGVDPNPAPEVHCRLCYIEAGDPRLADLPPRCQHTKRNAARMILVERVATGERFVVPLGDRVSPCDHAGNIIVNA